MKPLLTISQAAALLNMSEKTIYNHIYDTRLKFPYVKMGGCIRFREEDLEKYVESRLVKPSNKKRVLQTPN